ncbi:MAG: hypothetical protein KGH81_01165 [Thaumarchaeota archaeon]|nr:hypothetical protein [Nitrososphaerota archaeon]MDE1877548.1 hypothetical protein [Nitrososphaerota archaeon]
MKTKINKKIKVMFVLHLLAIVVAAGVLMLATENAFAESTTKSPNTNSQVRTDNSVDLSDESNYSHTNVNDGLNGIVNTEQPDQIESQK